MNNDIPLVEPAVDYTQIPPINQKRTVAFVNHFIVHLVTFLNKFSLSCEEKLFNFENKIQKVEATLAILEARLSTIPDGSTEQTTESNKVEESQTIDQVEVEAKKESDEPDNGVPQESKDKETEDPPASLDPVYEKYFKMIHFGVPKPAVKLKMEQEGLDSSILDNPQKPS